MIFSNIREINVADQLATFIGTIIIAFPSRKKMIEKMKEDNTCQAARAKYHYTSLAILVSPISNPTFREVNTLKLLLATSEAYYELAVSF
jgi:hypothetical protein